MKSRRFWLYCLIKSLTSSTNRNDDFGFISQKQIRLFRLMNLMLRFSTPGLSFPLNCFENLAKMTSEFPTQRRSSLVSAVNFTSSSKRKKLPVILFDIMDTVVRDPFYQDVPAFFRMPMKELMECKHPTAWIEFEKGLISEVELARKFFKDERHLDLEGLKNCMINGYSYIEGVEELLRDLKHNDYEMHAFTNYPIWYQLIEDKLRVSNYLSWTFCSCVMGKRKPDPEFYLEVLRHLQVEPADCIFIDDRLKNVEAASKLGIVGIQFKNAHLLRHELISLGLQLHVSTEKIV